MLKSLYWRVNFFLKNRKSIRFVNRLGKDVKAVIVGGKLFLHPGQQGLVGKLDFSTQSIPQEFSTKLLNEIISSVHNQVLLESADSGDGFAVDTYA